MLFTTFDAIDGSHPLLIPAKSQQLESTKALWLLSGCCTITLWQANS